jgi:anti-sigma regulatory factor (Ser/Thr protein kinase)
MAAIRRAFQFSDTDGSPRRARRAVRQALLDWSCGEALADTAELLTSELATNAVLHATDGGGAGYLVEVEIANGLVTVGVTDRGKGRPGAGSASADDEHGRGLAMVSALSRDWGVEPCPERGGKRVFFTLAAPASTGAPTPHAPDRTASSEERDGGRTHGYDTGIARACASERRGLLRSRPRPAW